VDEACLRATPDTARRRACWAALMRRQHTVEQLPVGFDRPRWIAGIRLVVGERPRRSVSSRTEIDPVRRIRLELLQTRERIVQPLQRLGRTAKPP